MYAFMVQDFWVEGSCTDCCCAVGGLLVLCFCFTASVGRERERREVGNCDHKLWVLSNFT